MPACVTRSVMSASSLIAAVRKRRALWDPTDVHHHNRVLVAALWRQIGQELGVNMMVAKSKWRGLRDYYRQQLRRAMEQPEVVAGSSWAHFEEMAFLGPPITVRSHKVENEVVGAAAGFEDGSWSPESQQWLNTDATEDPTPDCGDTDDDLLFFRSLLPDLRQLPRQKKAWIRLQIQEIVFKEVYSGRRSPQPASPSPPPAAEMPCKVELSRLEE